VLEREKEEGGRMKRGVFPGGEGKGTLKKRELENSLPFSAGEERRKAPISSAWKENGPKPRERRKRVFRPSWKGEWVERRACIGGGKGGRVALSPSGKERENNSEEGR